MSLLFRRQRAVSTVSDMISVALLCRQIKLKQSKPVDQVTPNIIVSPQVKKRNSNPRDPQNIGSACVCALGVHDTRTGTLVDGQLFHCCSRQAPHSPLPLNATHSVLFCVLQPAPLCYGPVPLHHERIAHFKPAWLPLAPFVATFVHKSVHTPNTRDGFVIYSSVARNIPGTSLYTPATYMDGTRQS